MSATVSAPTSSTSVAAPTVTTTLAAPAATRPRSTVGPGATTSASTSSSPTGASAGAAASGAGDQRRSTRPGTGATFSAVPALSSADTQSVRAASSARTLVALRAGLASKGFALHPAHANGKLAVRLSFVLPAPARITFLVFGPGRDCNLVGWFTVAAHPGLNQVLFRGHVQKHQLNPGLYRLVPSAQSKAVESLPRLGIIVDRRGVRPSGPADWRDCGNAAPAASPPGGGLAPSPPLNGVAGIAFLKAPSWPNVPTAAEPNPRRAPAFPLGADSTLLRDAFGAGLLSLSLMLLGVAHFRLSPGVGGYRAARVVVRHREEIACLGLGLLGCAAILFFL